MTMTRTHIDPIFARGFAAGGTGSCARRGMAVFPNPSPLMVSAHATT